MQAIKASSVDNQVHYYNGSGLFVNEVQMQDAREAAYYLGGQYSGFTDIALPSQINNSPTLMAAWNEGREDASYFERVQECQHCSAANGDPCLIHD